MHNIVKQFLWKAAHDIFPTRENIFKKKMIDLALLETTTHALWSCPASMMFGLRQPIPFKNGLVWRNIFWSFGRD